MRRDKVLTAISQAKLKEQLPDMVKRDSPHSLEDKDDPAASSTGLSDLNAEVRKTPFALLPSVYPAKRTRRRSARSSHSIG